MVLAQYPLFTRQLWQVIGVGDVDRDGYADVAVRTVSGPPVVTSPDRRRFVTEIVRGQSVRGVATSMSVLVDAEPVSTELGGVASLGDVDGDGFSDLAVVTEGGMPSQPQLDVF